VGLLVFFVLLFLLIGFSCRAQAEMVVGPVQPPPGMSVTSTGSLVMNGPGPGVVHPVMNGNGH